MNYTKWVTHILMMTVSAVLGKKVEAKAPLKGVKGHVLALTGLVTGFFVARKVNKYLSTHPQHRSLVYRTGYITDCIVTLHSRHKVGDWSFEANPIARYMGSKYGSHAAIAAIVIASELHLNLQDGDKSDLFTYARSMAVLSHLPGFFGGFNVAEQD